MKIDRLDVIENMVGYCLSKVIFEKPNKMSSREDLNQFMLQVSYDIYEQVAEELPTTKTIFKMINHRKKIKALIFRDQYLEYEK
jgi:hypothetical protein